MRQDEVQFDAQGSLLREKARLNRRFWRTVSQVALIIFLGATLALAFEVAPMQDFFYSLSFEIPAVSRVGLGLSMYAERFWWFAAVAVGVVSVLIWRRHCDRFVRPLGIFTAVAAGLLFLFTSGTIVTAEKAKKAFADGLGAEETGSRRDSSTSR